MLHEIIAELEKTEPVFKHIQDAGRMLLKKISEDPLTMATTLLE